MSDVQERDWRQVLEQKKEREKINREARKEVNIEVNYQTLKIINKELLKEKTSMQKLLESKQEEIGSYKFKIELLENQISELLDKIELKKSYVRDEDTVIEKIEKLESVQDNHYTEIQNIQSEVNKLTKKLDSREVNTKRKGFYVYNDSEEKYFDKKKDAIKFIGCSYYEFNNMLEDDITYNGWEAEEAL